jgi:hypothetical protein
MTSFGDWNTRAPGTAHSLDSMPFLESLGVESLPLGLPKSHSSLIIEGTLSISTVSAAEQRQQSGSTVLQTGVLIGMVAGVIAVLVCVVWIVYAIWRCTRSLPEKTTESDTEMDIPVDTFGDAVGNVVFENQMDTDGDSNRSDVSPFEWRGEEEPIAGTT